MKQQLITMLVLGSLAFPAAADEKAKKETKPRPPVTKKTPDAFPEGIVRFNGMLVGRLVKKDVETGTFLINVDAIPRVWRNSKAENPKSIVGKNVIVNGVSGKWLDVLLVVKEGETLECEAHHVRGEQLTFPGELLRKVAPYDPKDYPVLPEQFRGFNGAVAAKIVKKDREMFELIVQVDRVIDTWKNNRAKNAKTIEGKQMMLAGFWRRKEQYHGLKVGDHIEVGIQHIGMRSEHLTVAEFIRKTEGIPGKRPVARSKETEEGGLPDGMNGFLGSLVGTLVEKDVEKGTLVMKVDAVPRIWRQNRARKPKSIIGKNVRIEGVSNRLLDVLLTTRKGETLEVAGRHVRGNSLTFPGELFRKVAPYKPEDYPVLPDEFRGFQGMVSAQIVKKDKTMYGLIIKVTDVNRSFNGSKAKKPESIKGKTAILSGFWRRKDVYGKLNVGDRIEAVVRNEVTGTDVLSVIEGVRKVGESENPKKERTEKPREER